MLAVALLAVIAAVLILTLGGSGGGGHHRRERTARQATRTGHSDAQLAASYLGLSPAALRRRLRQGETLSEVAESIPGHSPRELIQTVLAYRAAELRKRGLTPAQVREREAELRDSLSGALRRKRRLGAALAPASRYMGISPARLRTELRAGRTLAQIAAAHGHSRAELLAGLERARAKRLGAARRAGTITPAQEREALAVLRRRDERLIDAGLSGS
jgi:hypothetical protein